MKKKIQHLQNFFQLCVVVCAILPFASLAEELEGYIVQIRGANFALLVTTLIGGLLFRRLRKQFEADEQLAAEGKKA